MPIDSKFANSNISSNIKGGGLPRLLVATCKLSQMTIYDLKLISTNHCQSRPLCFNRLLRRSLVVASAGQSDGQTLRSMTFSSFLIIFEINSINIIDSFSFPLFECSARPGVCKMLRSHSFGISNKLPSINELAIRRFYRAQQSALLRTHRPRQRHNSWAPVLQYLHPPENDGITFDV